MERLETCPCPKLACPNHGLCDQCASAHAKKGKVNYCGYIAIRASLAQAIEADPDSAAGQKIAELLESHEQAYAGLREKNNISDEQQEAKEQAMIDYIDS